MFGFLCISGYTYYDGDKIYLNLHDVHPEESTHFWEKRKGIKLISELKKDLFNEE